MFKHMVFAIYEDGSFSEEGLFSSMKRAERRGKQLLKKKGVVDYQIATCFAR